MLAPTAEIAPYASVTTPQSTDTVSLLTCTYAVAPNEC